MGEEYNLSEAYSSFFYSKDIADTWNMCVDREFLEEHNIDSESYGAKNMVKFFVVRNLLSTVTTAGSYSEKIIREFYCNLTENLRDPRYAIHGKVYMRGQIFQFSPAIINGFLGTHFVEDAELPSLDVMTSVLTGRLVTSFPAHPHKLAAAKLTSFYSVLHKTTVKTRIPFGNSIVVTNHQAPVLYAIGTGVAFNYGRLVFDTVMTFEDFAQPTLKLPYPSLIYSMLKSQGIEKDDDETLTEAGELLKISLALLRGNRKIDLPWSESSVAAGVVTDVSNTSLAPEIFVPPSNTKNLDTAFIQAQLLHSERKITQAKAHLAYYEGLKAHYKTLLYAVSSSVQKWGDDDGGKGK
ncbi:uncharacterized protein [Henckelia pumila]|uniref:uncharacterized protein n=1 Tax=Henckelia pumila TaxID=405737 RepID=UPI003C6E6D14